MMRFHFSAKKLLKYLVILFLALIALVFILYLGYGHEKPWINKPLDNPTANGKIGLGSTIPGDHTKDFSTVVALTFSGGGTRAAAFSYGVLEGLRDSPISGGKSGLSLLDEVELVSGVSGGSIMASYYVAFGAKTFTSFKEQFLYQDYQDNLMYAFLSPSKLFELMSPWYGRGNLLVDHLDELFQKKTFGDLPTRPRLLVSATDLSKSREFPFTPEQFALICSDLNSVPLAYAVGASSSLPLIFTPIAFKNYTNTDECINKSSIQINPDLRLNYRTKGLLLDNNTYLNSPEKKYVHLVDGAIADNLGLVSLIDRSNAEGITSLVDKAPPKSIHRLVFIVVNSRATSTDEIDLVQAVPGVGQVINAVRTSMSSKASDEVTRRLTESVNVWRKEIKQGDLSKSPFAEDAQIHLIMVNLFDIPDVKMRKKLESIPTTLQLPNNVVDELIVAGKKTLFSAPGYDNLMKELRR